MAEEDQLQDVAVAEMDFTDSEALSIYLELLQHLCTVALNANKMLEAQLNHEPVAEYARALCVAFEEIDYHNTMPFGGPGVGGHGKQQRLNAFLQNLEDEFAASEFIEANVDNDSREIVFVVQRPRHS
jgi:hypothetical protein